MTTSSSSQASSFAGTELNAGSDRVRASDRGASPSRLQRAGMLVAIMLVPGLMAAASSDPGHGYEHPRRVPSAGVPAAAVAAMAGAAATHARPQRVPNASVPAAMAAAIRGTERTHAHPRRVPNAGVPASASAR